MLKPLNKRMSQEDISLIAIAAIDLLSNEQRLALRNDLEANGYTKLPRNLYYNYDTQEWIGFPNITASEAANG